MLKPEEDWIDEAELRELQSRWERELAELEQKLGLSSKPDEGPGRRYPGGLDDPLGGAGVPAPVVPPQPTRPAADAKPLPPEQ